MTPEQVVTVKDNFDFIRSQQLSHEQLIALSLLMTQFILDQTSIEELFP